MNEYTLQLTIYKIPKVLGSMIYTVSTGAFMNDVLAVNTLTAHAFFVSEQHKPCEVHVEIFRKGTKWRNSKWFADYKYTKE
ncbi:MAG: hypothetical protein WCT49_06385 [Candidatus Paceibacterota bacterium]|jgi:hypothetical protein|nr:hypothetical protein [Candidatus Paceibacterota bacterium]